MTAIPLPNARATIEARVWLVLSWAALVLLLAAVVLLLASRQWQTFRITASFLLPLLMMLLIPHGLPPLLVAITAGCVLVSAAGWALDWYALFWWFDVVIHALNPFAMMAGSMVMLWKAEWIRARRPGRFVLVSTALGLALGIAWELFEFTFLDLTWPDTILDLVMDAVGAALGGWFALWLIKAWGRPPRGRRRARLRTLEPAPIRLRR